MKSFVLIWFSLLLFSLNSFGTEINCPAGQFFVKSHQRKGYTKSDGTIVRSTNVKSHCKVKTKVDDYLEARIKNGKPTSWPHKKELSTDWTEEEKQLLRESLANLPDILLSKRIGGFYRSKKSKDYPNPASSSNGIIVLYDSAFDSSRNLGEIIAHELSHQNYLDLTETERQDYGRAMGWHFELHPNRKFYLEGRKSGYVEDDGILSPEEDYANNLEYFLYNADKLKKVTPEAYSWIRKKFGEGFQLKEKKR